MRRIYQTTGLTLLFLALFLGYRSVILQYYTPLGPGPGFFPLWLCIILGLLAAGMVVQATLVEPEAVREGFLPTRASYLRMGAIIVSIFGVAAFVNVVGFRLTMLVFYVALLSALARRHPVETIILAIIGSFGVYYVFTSYLSRPLPVGILGI